MASEPYRGYQPLAYEQMLAIQHDSAAVAKRVRDANQFMEREVPLLAAAAGLPKLNRPVKREACEEGGGRLAHRVFIARRPWEAAFVVMPADLEAGDADDFMAVVTPTGDHLVVAAKSYEPGFRAELANRWKKPLTLLTFAGTEDKHEYEVYEGE